MPLLQLYRSFVLQHPSLVLNAERLLRWIAWNPERFSGSEYAYEGFNAAVGLLSLYNESILDEGNTHPTAASWALCLAAVQEVQTLVELRAIHLEKRGKMSRYGPLMALELLKAVLRLCMWRRSGCNLVLDDLTQEDWAQHESEQQMKELMQALTRLRSHYSCDAVPAPTQQQQQPPASSSKQQPTAPQPPPAHQQQCMQPSGSCSSSSSKGQQQQQQQQQCLRSVSCSSACLPHHQVPSSNNNNNNNNNKGERGGVAAGRSVMLASELLFAVRPLVYVWMIRRYGLTSWRPWLLSLSLDLASSYSLEKGAAMLCHSRASGWPPSSTLYSLALLRCLSSSRWSPREQQELLQRRLHLLRYLLRSPCYNVATRRVLRQVVAASSWIPGISNLADFVFCMVEGMQSYYTYVES